MGFKDAAVLKIMRGGCASAFLLSEFVVVEPCWYLVPDLIDD